MLDWTSLVGRGVNTDDIRTGGPVGITISFYVTPFEDLMIAPPPKTEALIALSSMNDPPMLDGRTPKLLTLLIEVIPLLFNNRLLLNIAQCTSLIE